MSELILIRHGESKGNANKGIIQGSGADPENTLSAAGIKQANRGGFALACLGIKPLLVRSSKLERATQTRDIFLDIMGLQHVPSAEDLRLNEMCKGLKDLPGGMEGRRREDVETPEYWEAYRREGWTFRHGSLESGGETAQEVGQVGLAAFNDIADELDGLGGGTALVFAHGQRIRFAIGQALGHPDVHEVNRLYMMGNCEGLRMERGNGQWQFTGRIATAAA